MSSARGWSDVAWPVVLVAQAPHGEDEGLGFAASVLRALAGAWAQDGEYAAADLRAVADEIDPGGAT